MYFAIVEDLKEDQNHLAGLIREDCLAHGEQADFLFFFSGEDFLDAYRKGMCGACLLYTSWR